MSGLMARFRTTILARPYENYRWRNSMKTIARIGLVAVGLVLFSLAAFASDVTIPNTFTAGTTAKAAEVNANFAAVEAAVDDNDARIDTLVSTAAIKDGALQTNLNADMLDGAHEASFFRLGEPEIVTGIPEFNGGTTGSSPPFKVDSTYVVTNLNADLLDGVTSGSFLRSDTSAVHTGTYLQVNGNLLAYGNYLYMNSGSDYLRYDTANARFYLSDNLYVVGTLAATGAVTVPALTATGTVTVSSEVNKSGYTANLLPIAYGTVYVNTSTGAITLYSSSGNISVSRQAAGTYYVTITGYSFYYLDYIVAGCCINSVYLFGYGSVSGNLVVYTSKSGALADITFSFVVYKP